jgi:hypothetical protein
MKGSGWGGRRHRLRRGPRLLRPPTTDAVKQGRRCCARAGAGGALEARTSGRHWQPRSPRARSRDGTGGAPVGSLTAEASRGCAGGSAASEWAVHEGLARHKHERASQARLIYCILM